MSPVGWVLLVAVVGVVLVVASGSATTSVSRGPTFVKWMLVVFAAFLVLASIPILAGS
jgi:threonine/homoserine/homoserine lactone efflux protein